MTLSPQDMFYMAIGLISIILAFWFNRHLYRGGGLSGLEAVYYLTAFAALLIGWYFNLQYMRQYGAQAGWAHWTRLLFANPAAASGGQDLIIANVIVLPLWTIIDGRRCGMRASWWYFPMSLITSYAFAIALFLAVKERQLRRA